ncbi:long-chain-fatty-acid-CoA ligase [Klebsiella michiganensis]|uniref:Long-chain-fatty-acid-CoA ligase n=1 Tax=Klebsiella michiganensis TaxID=1134687 RepID=A0A7H4M6J3_9ENTR|nr:long-chain-fatty-acid-CoA ligase [Klebsiella michiganensis]
MSSTSADFQNLYQALRHSAARSPDALALAFEDRRYLYRDFHLRVQRAMAQLDQVWSLRKGDRILLAWGIIPLFAKSFLPRLVWASKWCLSALSLSRPKARSWWAISPRGSCCSMRPYRTG